MGMTSMKMCPGRCTDNAALEEFDCGAIDDYFCGALHYRGGGIANVDYGIGIHGFGFLNHALGSQCAGLVHHFRIGFQFAAHQGLEGLRDVFAHIF